MDKNELKKIKHPKSCEECPFNYDGLVCSIDEYLEEFYNIESVIDSKDMYEGFIKDKKCPERPLKKIFIIPRKFKKNARRK